MMISEAIAIKTGCTVAEGAARIWFVDSKGLVSALTNSLLILILPVIHYFICHECTHAYYTILYSFIFNVQITNSRTDELAHHKLPFAHNPPAPSSSMMDDNNCYP